MTQLSKRRHDILRVLAVYLRLMVIEIHVAPYWFGETKNPIHNARIEVRLLRNAGYVETRSVMIPELPSVEMPLATWKPGDATPDLGAVAWQAKKRWGETVRRTIVIATTKTKQLFGFSRAREVRAREVGHDATVASVYLQHFYPDTEGQWVSEDQLIADGRGKQDGEPVPDAMVEGAAIEFVGQYSTAKLRRIHAAYAARNQPYQLW